VSVGSGCFVITNAKYNWIDAANYCSSQGAALATISSSRQNRLIWQHFIDYVSNIDYYAWIGLNDISQEGVYEWLDKSVNTTGFRAGKLSDSSSLKNCFAVYMSMTSNGDWSNIDCNSSQFALCMWNTTLSQSTYCKY
jgi:hypothetical protein